MTAEYEKARCKFCSSQNTVKNGKRKGTQFWLCRGCGRAFVDNGAFPGMRNRIECVALALDEYYKGYSLTEICDHIERSFRVRPSNAAIHGWVMRFSEVAVDKVSRYRPRVGDIWIADEGIVMIGGQKLWLWDIIDSDTRYLLASYLIPQKTVGCAQILLELALRKAGKAPKIIVAAELRAFFEVIELAAMSGINLIHNDQFLDIESLKLVKRFHGMSNDRAKILLNLKKPETAEIVVEGWVFLHNYLRVYESLGNRTPAEFAGINSSLRSWLDVISYQAYP